MTQKDCLIIFDDIKKTYELVAHEKQTEIRLIDPHKKEPPKSIFVNNEKDFVETCNTWNNVYNIYVGINERKENGKEAKDVISTKTIVIDIDPERETNTASTKEELEKAKQTAFNIEQEFVNRGFIRPAKAMSGNGIQLWFTFPKIIITDENRKEIEGKTKKFIHNIQTAFNSKEVKIDQIGDLPRIIKVMGTKSIKGTPTTDRPHRTAQWLYYNGRQEDPKFKEELLKLEPIKQEETIIGEKKESRSETEFGAVCAYIQKGLTKEQIFSKMMAFDKWAHAHHPSYRELTYTKAMKTVADEPKQTICEDDVPTLDLISFQEYDDIFENTHKHLPGYKLIDAELGLEGKEYYPIKKIMNYRIESIKQKTITISVGKEWTDNRLHVLFFGGAGTGKGILKSAIRLNKDAVECSGARTNLEQLIGKIDKKQNEIEGYFRKECLDVDECHTLITEEDRNLAGVMREFRIAMDTFGRNTVDKKNVDAERFLSYNPTTRFGFYSHDTILPPVFFDLGTARRLFAFELKPVEVNEDAAINSLLLENKTEELREYINRKDWNTSSKGFSKEAIQELIYWIKAWNKFCLLNTNQRIRILGKRMFFSGKQYFMRLTTILSLMRNEPQVTMPTTKQACFDCFQFLLKTIELYGNKSVITLSRDIWKTSDINEAMLFEWLHYKGALSKEESTIMIKDVQEQIQDIFGVTSDRQAKSIYKKLKKNGYIHDYKGQHDSVAWLGFYPNVEDFVKFEDNTPLDLRLFLEKEREKLSEMTEVNSWGGISHSVQPNISSSFYNNTQNNTNNFDKIELIMPPTPHTSNTSELKKNNFTMIDGDLPSKICSECRVDGPVVAVCGGQFYCEDCYEKLSK
jgi:hypothetical protein